MILYGDSSQLQRRWMCVPRNRRENSLERCSHQSVGPNRHSTKITPPTKSEATFNKSQQKWVYCSLYTGYQVPNNAILYDSNSPSHSTERQAREVTCHARLPQQIEQIAMTGSTSSSWQPICPTWETALREDTRKPYIFS